MSNRLSTFKIVTVKIIVRTKASKNLIYYKVPEGRSRVGVDLLYACDLCQRSAHRKEVQPVATY